MHAVIMAGGSGTRFWPASRRHRPKQLLELWGEPMVARTVRRLFDVAPVAQQWIITSATLADAIAAAVPELARERVIGEPVGRNTAPCVGLAAAILEKDHGDVVFGLFPADHFVTDQAAWVACLERAAREAEAGAIVTLGIRPTRPETGYGYVQTTPGGADADAPRDVVRFVEKPDRATAERYLASGAYLWNAGIFVTRVSTMRREIARQMPALHEGLEVLQGAWGTPAWAEAFASVYPTLPSISVDYGVMEGAEKVRVVPATFGWSDVGHWGALDETLPADDQGNVSVGEALHVDSRHVVAVSLGGVGKRLVTLGLDDLVVVDTPDALLVCRRDRVQDVRQVVDRLEALGLEALL